MDVERNAQKNGTRSVQKTGARSRAIGTALLALTVVGTMGCAAHRYDAHGNHYYEPATHGHGHATRGAILGGLAGAGVGRAIAGHHNDEAGFWIGGALGALTGAVIGDTLDREEARHYEEEHRPAPPPPPFRRDRHDHPDRDHEDDWDDDWDDEDDWDRRWDRDRHSRRDGRDRDAPRFLSLPGEVLFAEGSTELERGAKRRLRAVAQALRKHPGTVAVVRGHASQDERRRRSLADARADAVRQYLLGEGVAPSRVTAVGMGARFPVASSDSSEGRQRNRRVELELQTERERELAGLW